VESSNPLWSILHSPNIILNHPGRIIFVTYALIPWVGVTAAGYGLGQIYRWPSERRKALLLPLGIRLGRRHSSFCAASMFTVIRFALEHAKGPRLLPYFHF
jgi:uncharacterized membrane protein